MNSGGASMDTPERLVLCGAAAGSRTKRGEALALNVAAPDGAPERVNLSLAHITSRMAANLPARFVDLLEIACYVYCADQFTRRGSPTLREMGAHWRRRFRFRIPVRDLTTWRRSDISEALVDVLAFLSEDDYRFEFVQSDASPLAEPYLEFGSDGAPAGFDPDRIMLFSGGLDSFTGAAEALCDGERVALVSHRSSPMLRGKQSRLVEALRDRTKGAQLFHVSVAANKGSEEAREFTQRARSFLFATLGFVVARLFKKNDISFYENGVVSLNLPLAEHVLGARSTRTTHPRVLHGFGRLFSLLADEAIRFVNPFFWRTKAEVVQLLADLGSPDLIRETFSCTRVREATKSKKHCGVCSQCLDRRFAVLAAGQDAWEPPDTYAVDLFAGERNPGADLTLAESYVLTAAKMAKMSEVAFLSNYGQVFRALRYLEGEPVKVAARLHQLHVRHGQAVAQAIDRELARRATLQDALALPTTSLIAMIQSPIAAQPAITDSVEHELPASVQAASSVHRVLQRPIRFAVDQDTKRVVFAHQITLKRAGFRVVVELLKEYREDQEKNRSPDHCRSVAARRLAERLDVDEDTLRQTIRRIRRRLATDFQAKMGVALDDADVIETVDGRGYRLNPHLALVSAAVIEAVAADRERDVTGNSESVTSAPPNPHKSAPQLG